MAKRVLFVCVKNTSRSQMAEALLKMSLPAAEAYSAGTHPGEEVNPMAVAAMRELGYDLSTHRSKHVSAFLKVKFDLVFKMDAPDLSDYVNEFRRVRDMLAERIGRLRRQLGAPLAA